MVIFSLLICGYILSINEYVVLHTNERIVEDQRIDGNIGKVFYINPRESAVDAKRSNHWESTIRLEAMFGTIGT